MAESLHRPGAGRGGTWAAAPGKPSESRGHREQPGIGPEPPEQEAAPEKQGAAGTARKGPGSDEAQNGRRRRGASY